MFIHSPFPISSACLRRSSWNFNLIIRCRQKVGLLLETLKSVFKKNPNPQFNHATAALLLLPGNRENPPRAICCLFVHLLINMPWLGKAYTSPAGKRGFGKLHVAAIGRNPPLCGRGSHRDSAKPICSFAELFTKMKGLGVAGLRFLLGSHFKNLLNFLALHLCSLALVQGCSQSHPVGCCSQHRILWGWLLQPRIPYPVLFFLLWFKKQFWKFSSGMEIDEKERCGLQAVFLDTWDQKGPLEL